MSASGDRVEFHPCAAIMTLDDLVFGQSRFAIGVADHLSRTIVGVEYQRKVDSASLVADISIENRHIALADVV